MDSLAYLHYREILKQEAAELVAHCSLPISMTDICKSLGVGIRQENLFDKRPRIRTNGRDVIVELPCSLRLDSREGRFCIAHELGHLVLERRCGVRPLGKSEYWQHEDLCDEFARHLLLPTHHIATLGTLKEEIPARKAFKIVSELGRQGDTSWLVSAQRVFDFDSRIMFFLVSQDQKRAAFRITATNLPSRRERGRLIQSAGGLSQALESFFWNYKDAVADVGGELLRDSGIPSCQGALSGFLRRIRTGAAITVFRQLSTWSEKSDSQPGRGLIDRPYDNAERQLGLF